MHFDDLSNRFDLDVESSSMSVNDVTLQRLKNAKIKRRKETTWQRQNLTSQVQIQM